ncbi:hypothetical protein ACTFIT_002219 [Dictyostelium discoideum]
MYLEKYQEDDIAIIGVGLRLPGEESGGGVVGELLNDSPQNFWNNLKKGFNGISKTNERWSENYSKLGEISNGYAGVLPLEELKSFDPLFFGISPSEASTIDPQQRLLLKTTWESLEDAGIDHQSIRGSDCSVFIGSSTTEYRESIVNINEQYLNIFGTYAHGIANRISYCFDLRGESVTLDTACASSGTAISMGAQCIKNGKSKLSIVGGVNLIVDTTNIKAFSYLNMLSTSGVCRPFDIGADGLLRGEGVGTIVLKSLKDSIRDGNKIYCIIKGSSYNVDGNGNSDKQNFYAPSSISQSDNIKLAIKSTNGSITCDDIDYFECHGTGTPTGDPIETKGISMAFNRSKQNPLLIGSLKGSSGHSEAASGVIGVIKCCLIFKNKSLVPCVNFSKPNPQIKFEEWNLKVVTEPIPFTSLPSRKLNNKPISIAINNFGVTGANCCIILSEFINNNTNDNLKQINKSFLIPFSANSVKSLENYKLKLNSIINENDYYLNNSAIFNGFVNNQIYNKSKSLSQRSVYVASNLNELVDGKVNFKTSNSKSSNFSILKKKPIVLFVFSGQGSQYNTMFDQLYNDEIIFKESIDRIDNSLFKYYGYSVFEKFKSSNLNSIHEPLIAQAAISMLNISLFELYKHWGIEASFIVGHSLGEISAAHCSGMIDLETLCYIIYHRSIAQIKTHGNGRMLSINQSSDEYISKYSSKYADLEIACYNSQNSIVVAGNEHKLNQLFNELKENNEFATMIASQSSFHTSNQCITKDDIFKLQFTANLPLIPIFSTVTTNLFDNSTLFNSSYIYDNIICPVRFEQTISNFYKHIDDDNDKSDVEVVIIELAPHPTLSYYLKQMKPVIENKDIKVNVYSALHKLKNSTKEFQKVISQLYCDNGININFKCQLENQVNMYDTIFSLPNYQWDDQKYWKVDYTHSRSYINGPPITILGNESYNSPYLSRETYIDIKRNPFKYLNGHQIKMKIYFPGMGYIDNLLKLFKNNHKNIIIDQIEFIAPLILNEGINQCVQTNVNQIEINEYSLNCYYKDIKSNEWVKTCIGNFHISNNLFTQQRNYNINQLINEKCNYSLIERDDLYDMIKIKTGLNYSGDFKGINKCYIGNSCSLSEVSMNLPDNLPDKESFFNCTILDSCTHGFLVLIDYQCQLVFHKVEGLRYYNSNIPTDRNKHKNIYVYSILNQILNDSFHSSVIIMLEDGTVLIEIDNLISKSLTPIQDPLKIEYPMNELFSTHLQPKDSPFPLISMTFKSKFKNINEIKNEFMLNCCKNFISNQFLSNIINRTNIKLNEIKTLTIDQLVKLYCLYNNNERLFRFVFETIKKYDYNSNHSNNENEMVLKDDGIYQVLDTSIKVISKLLFPYENDKEDPITETPTSLFENGLLDKFYGTNNFMTTTIQRNLITDIIINSLKPILNQKLVIRIVELGGGVCSFTVDFLEKLDKLLKENPFHEIEIEFTWSDISSSFIPEAKKKLEPFSNNINIVYRSIDIEKEFKKQGLKHSYFDFIILTNVLHVVKNIGNSLDQLYKILSPNGQILLIEPYVSIVNDSIFGSFSQWWSFEDTEIRKTNCCMEPNSWLQVFKNHNFKNTNSYEEDGSCCYVIHSQKPPLLYGLNELKYTQSPNQIIIYGNENENENENENYTIKFNKSVIKISNIDQFNQSILNSQINNETIIYFTKSINQLDVNNFKFVTFEYIQINKLLLKYKLKSKHVLITLNSRDSNYLSASLVGAKRYFEEYPQLSLKAIDFDLQSLEEIKDIQSLLIELLDENKNTQNDYIIKNCQVYYERVKKEIISKSKFISNSFENNDSLITQLIDSEYKLTSNKPIFKVKEKEEGEEEVEIKVLSTTIGNVNDGDNFGEFSGIITRVCSNSNFKIGEKVYGFGYNTTSSHIVVNGDWIYYKPLNISNNNAASIPYKYLEVLYGLYNIGELDENENILIHLNNNINNNNNNISTLNILKWKGHKGLIYVTVDSNEMEIYVNDNFGGFISGGIFNLNNYKNYIQEIKSKHDQGIDLIINSSINSFHSDIKCLNSTSRIINFNYLNNNNNDNNDLEFFYKYCRKLNIGYHFIDLKKLIPIRRRGRIIKDLFKEISKAIENNEINLLPIIDYSNLNINHAIQMVKNEKNMVHTIVIENNEDVLENLLKEHSNNSTYSIIKSDYKISENHLGKNLIITGQIGVALEVLKWICKYSKGVENIIILSKSLIKWELKLLIDKTYNSKENNQIKFHFNTIDISNSNELTNTLNQLLKDTNIDNIDSIFHYAFTKVVSEVEDIDLNQLNLSHGAKTMGAINLHNESVNRCWNLKNFINASSTVTLAGSPGQCTYVCANSVLDSLSRYRKSIGLPSICSYYGSIKSGIVLRSESIATSLEKQGYVHVSMNKFLGALDLQIQNPNLSTNLIVSNFNFKLFKNNPQHSIIDKFEHQINENNSKLEISTNNNPSTSTESNKGIDGLLLSKVSELLSINETNFNADITLIDYGADSLITSQLKNFIEKEFSLSVTSQQLQRNSINQLIKFLNKK